MSEKKYVAYVGSYTHGSSRQGIHVYDVDVENGTLTERSSVEVSNASHMAVSKNCKYLYSNFKKENGYQHSIKLSQEYNLYRQDYCGCEFSLFEHQEILDKKQ